MIKFQDGILLLISSSSLFFCGIISIVLLLLTTTIIFTIAQDTPFTYQGTVPFTAPPSPPLPSRRARFTLADNSNEYIFVSFSDHSCIARYRWTASSESLVALDQVTLNSCSSVWTMVNQPSSLSSTTTPNVIYFICSGQNTDQIIYAFDSQSFTELPSLTMPNYRTLAPASFYLGDTFDPETSIADNISIIVASAAVGRGYIVRYFFSNRSSHSTFGFLDVTSVAGSGKTVDSFTAGAIDGTTKQAAYFCTGLNPSFVVKICNLSNDQTPFYHCGTVNLSPTASSCMGLAVTEDGQHVFAGGNNFVGGNVRAVVTKIFGFDMTIVQPILFLTDGDYDIMSFIADAGYLIFRSWTPNRLHRVRTSDMVEVNRTASDTLVGTSGGSTMIPNTGTNGVFTFYFYGSQDAPSSALRYYRSPLAVAGQTTPSAPPTPVPVPSTSSTTTTTSTSTSTSTTTSSTTTTTTEPPSTTKMIPLNPPVGTGTKTGTGIAITITSPFSVTTATQVQRGLTIISLTTTAQRCALFFSSSAMSVDTETGLVPDYTDQDIFASENLHFPESLLPWWKIQLAENDATGFNNSTFVIMNNNENNNDCEHYLENRFALPSRRGAIVFGTIIFPILILIASLSFGYYRQQKTLEKQQRRRRMQINDDGEGHGHHHYNLGVLASGHTPGLFASFFGALALDGIICSSVVLLSVPRQIFAQHTSAGGAGSSSCSITAHSDGALGMWGIFSSLFIVILPGILLKKEKDALDEQGTMELEGQTREESLIAPPSSSSPSSQLQCIPSAYYEKQKGTRDGDEKESSYGYGEIKLTGNGYLSSLLYICCGTETWSTTSSSSSTLEKFRTIFIRNHGLNQEHEMNRQRELDAIFVQQSKSVTSLSSIGVIAQYARRVLCFWSIYIDLFFCILCAAMRGWATTQPCQANGHAQRLVLFSSIMTFLKALILMPAISPLKKCTNVLVCSLLMIASSFITQEKMFEVRTNASEDDDVSSFRQSTIDTSLAASYIAMVFTIALVVFRRVVLPWRKIQIIAKEENDGAGQNNNVKNLTKKNFKFDGREVGRSIMMMNVVDTPTNNKAAPHHHQAVTRASPPQTATMRTPTSSPVRVLSTTTTPSANASRNKIVVNNSKNSVNSHTKSPADPKKQNTNITKTKPSSSSYPSSSSKPSSSSTRKKYYTNDNGGLLFDDI